MKLEVVNGVLTNNGYRLTESDLALVATRFNEYDALRAKNKSLELLYTGSRMNEMYRDIEGEQREFEKLPRTCLEDVYRYAIETAVLSIRMNADIGEDSVTFDDLLEFAKEGIESYD